MEFKAIQKTKTYKQIINSKPEIIFPLLCPVREKDWLDGWDYKMIFSKSGLIEKGCVFSTPHHSNIETIWYVTHYDTENFSLEFLRMTPNELVVKINISLIENDQGTTSCNISYQYTSLSTKANIWINSNLDNDFLKNMLWWEMTLNHFLKTGEKLKKE